MIVVARFQNIIIMEKNRLETILAVIAIGNPTSPHYA